ncbi:SET domain-containing protein [Panacagrimonas sp.]|uniref:SET domain-containing protein n=1 Tax=Panacagrimonas sp. TaxID=2480088 RepID=UPI003B52FC65
MTFPSVHAPLARIAGWGGERQLVASADAEPGALLVAEYPIAFAQTHEGEDDVGSWLLLETILSSAEMFEQVSAQDLRLTKWPLAPEDEATLDHIARKYRRNPKKLAQLYHRVATNNIRYRQAGVTGYGIWPTLSRSNHSCDPNAELRGAPQSPLAELLLATRPISKDTAICWNYQADTAFLTLDWFERNQRLHRDFQFLCRCPRCESERPAHVAGLSRTALAAYFQRPSG